MNKLFRPLLYACLCMLLAASCTKTDTIAPPELSQSRMLEYKIVNVQGNPIVGAVNDQDSTITVYLPFYLQLVTLEPEIKVSTGATVSPASSTLVEELLDVFQKGRDIKYTVTGKDGSKKTYTLKINVQQPSFTLTELSTADVPRNYNFRVSTGTAVRIPLKGAGFSENTDLVKAYLVDDAGKEYGPLPVGIVALPDTYSLDIFIDKAYPSGEEVLATFTTSATFKIRVYNYSKQATTQFPIKITKT